MEWSSSPQHSRERAIRSTGIVFNGSRFHLKMAAHYLSTRMERSRWEERDAELEVDNSTMAPRTERYKGESGENHWQKFLYVTKLPFRKSEVYDTTFKRVTSW